MNLIRPVLRLARATALCAAALAFAAVTLAASANANTYYFTNVEFSDGGFLSGYFTTGQYGGVASWNFTTTAGSLLGAEQYYSPNIYVNYYSSPSFSAPVTLDFFPNSLGLAGYSYELQLTFSAPVTGGATLLGGSESFECNGFSCPDAKTRYIDANYGGGSVTETPLPASWTMMLIGLVGLGAYAFRWQRRDQALAAAV